MKQVCGQLRTGASGIVWKCIREPHDGPTVYDRYGYPLTSQPSEQHWFVRA